MKKRILGLLLSIAVLLSMVVQFSSIINAVSATEVSTKLANLSSSDSKAKVGSTYFGSGGCWNFANYVSKAVFGVAIPSGTSGGYYLTASNSNWNTIKTISGSSASNDAVINLMKTAIAGDLIQYKNSYTNPQHTAIVYAVSDSGISIYDSVSSGVRLKTYTWSNFISGMGKWGGTSGYGISLYRCVNNVCDGCVNPQFSVIFTNTTKDSEVTADNIIVRVKVSYTGDAPKEVGVDVGTSVDNMTYFSNDTNSSGFPNPQLFNYSFKKYGITVSPGQTYYFRFYAKRVEGSWDSKDVCHSDIYSVTVPGTHSHTYTRYYEETHPHKVYMKCTCGEYYYTGENQISTINHAAQAPTCTSSGWNAYETCPLCDYSTYSTVQALGHSFSGAVTKNATCVESGVKTYTCSRCNDRYTETIAPLGHNYEAVVIPASCVQNGSTTYTCSRCGDNYSSDVIPATGHNYDAEITTVPSCTSDGVKTFTCTKCGDSYSQMIPANGHSFENGVCTVCGYQPNAPQTTIESVTAKSGDEVSVSVTLENVPEIKSMAISNVEFDLETLALLGGEWKVDGAVLSSWDENTGKGVVTLSTAKDLNGEEVFVLTFHIDDAADEGFYSISLKVSAKDAGNSEINVFTVSGGITVKNSLIGDLNGDEQVTDEDAIYLLFYTFFPEDYPVNQPCDFNGDGAVTDEDAIYILFYTFFPEDYPLN